MAINIDHVQFLLISENPYKEKGDLLNIRLNNTQESIEQTDGSYRPMQVESYFQMNFATGTYKTFRKARDIDTE